ncbi:unnamed protein product, partial [Phaeothamnion confervicola]
VAQSVVEAYVRRGWSTHDIRREAEQCVRDRLLDGAPLQEGEGCRLWGAMTVNKVAGNFHVAMGERFLGK